MKTPSDWNILLGRLRGFGLGQQPPLHMIQVTTTDATNINQSPAYTVSWGVAALIDKGHLVTHEIITNPERITVLADGVYELKASLWWTSGDDIGLSPYFYKNNTTILRGYGHGATNTSDGETATLNNTAGAHISCYQELAADDYIEVETLREGVAGTATLSSSVSLFSIRLIGG